MLRNIADAPHELNVQRTVIRVQESMAMPPIGCLAGDFSDVGPLRRAAVSDIVGSNSLDIIRYPLEMEVWHAHGVAR